MLRVSLVLLDCHLFFGWSLQFISARVGPPINNDASRTKLMRPIFTEKQQSRSVRAEMAVEVIRQQMAYECSYMY